MVYVKSSDMETLYNSHLKLYSESGGSQQALCGQGSEHLSVEATVPLGSKMAHSLSSILQGRTQVAVASGSRNPCRASVKDGRQKGQL